MNDVIVVIFKFFFKLFVGAALLMDSKVNCPCYYILTGKKTNGKITVNLIIRASSSNNECLNVCLSILHFICLYVRLYICWSVGLLICLYVS